MVDGTGAGDAFGAGFVSGMIQQDDIVYAIQLAMANSGPNTNGSQFFIVTASPEAPLPASYTIFGSVVSGLDVALKIESVSTDAIDRPVEDVAIKSVELLDK